MRRRVERQDLFDESVEQMRHAGYRVDIQAGVVRNKAEFVSRFVDYDWASRYEEAPHFIFYDFFQGILMNLYTRKLAGV